MVLLRRRRARHDRDARTASAVDVADVEAELERIGHELKPLDIVLVRTGRDEFYGELDYIARGPGVTAEATRWLYERGVRVMGIDAWGWDRPAAPPGRRGARAATSPGSSGRPTSATSSTRRSSASSTSRALPPTGFRVACFPLRIVGASAAPARVVAIVPDDAG